MTTDRKDELPRKRWRVRGIYDDRIDRESLHWTRRGAERSARRMRERHYCGPGCLHYTVEVARVWR